MTENDIFNALNEAYKRAGTQAALAKKAGISQGRIADYLNGRYSIGNMTCSTLLRLFPEILICFFRDEYPEKVIGTNVINSTGDINNPVNQVSGGISGFKNILGKREKESSSETIKLRLLERKIRRYEKFSPEERLKFLDFLDDEL